MKSLRKPNDYAQCTIVGAEIRASSRGITAVDLQQGRFPWGAARDAEH